jgi:hypothetical protein
MIPRGVLGTWITGNPHTSTLINYSSMWRWSDWVRLGLNLGILWSWAERPNHHPTMDLRLGLLCFLYVLPGASQDDTVMMFRQINSQFRACGRGCGKYLLSFEDTEQGDILTLNDLDLVVCRFFCIRITQYRFLWLNHPRNWKKKKHWELLLPPKWDFYLHEGHDALYDGDDFHECIIKHKCENVNYWP